MVVIGGMQTEGHGIIAKPENRGRFKTPQGFIGAKVATVRLASGDAIWRYGLTKAGVDRKNQVTIQELDSPGGGSKQLNRAALMLGACLGSLY